MALSLKPSHWKRYKDIAWLLVKYGRGDVASRLGMEADWTEDDQPAASGSSPSPEGLARDLERLGPS